MEKSHDIWHMLDVTVQQNIVRSIVILKDAITNAYTHTVHRHQFSPKMISHFLIFTCPLSTPTCLPALDLDQVRVLEGRYFKSKIVAGENGDKHGTLATQPLAKLDNKIGQAVGESPTGKGLQCFYAKCRHITKGRQFYISIVICIA